MELIDNKLSGKELIILSKFNNLQSLSLGGNNINSIDDINPLTKLTNLFQLDLINCKISELKDYSTKLFQIIPSLGVIKIIIFYKGFFFFFQLDIR